MSAVRRTLEDALRGYTTDILTDIQKIRDFCEKFSTWFLSRGTELTKIRDIKVRADQVGKCAVGRDIVFKMFRKNQTAKQYSELEKELEEVLMDTLRGLETLQGFLNAIERLAVSSVHVFIENQVIQFPENIGFDYVQVIINTAKLICPLLLEFKRDASDFFFPKIANAEVLAYQLDRYIQTTKKMCEKMEKSCLNDFCLTETEVVVELDVDLSEFNMQRMLDHINQLKDIRMDLDFRMVFLFQRDSGSSFMKEFSERQPRMLQFLNELEESAVQLDSMNKGVKISSVVGSSVGVVGGVLSIVSFYKSNSVTDMGKYFGFASVASSIINSITDFGLDFMYQRAASKVFLIFMEDVTELQDCLEEVSYQALPRLERGNIEFAVIYENKVLQVIKLVVALGKEGVKGVVPGLFEWALKKQVAKEAAEEAAAGPLFNIARVASAGKISDNIRRCYISVSALFLGSDIYSLYKDAKSLASGSEMGLSQFIRAKAALWSSEIDSWKKIHESLCDGQQTSGKKKALLETPFYLNTDV